MSVVVNTILCLVESSFDPLNFSLDRFIETAPNLYVLEIRCVYLAAFAEFTSAKKSEVSIQKLLVNAKCLDKAFIKIVMNDQSRSFGIAVELIRQDSVVEA